MRKIWEERRLGKHGKKETNRLYQYFQLYLNQDHPRSIPRLYKTLMESKDTYNGTIPKVKTLWNYCSEFGWVERVEAYDQYLMDVNRKNKELKLSQVYSDVADFNVDELKKSIDLVDYPKKVIADALRKYEADEISLDKFNKYVESVSKTYASLVELVQGYDSSGKSKSGGSFTNVNQIGKDNHMTFREFFEEKGDVIEELARDKESEKES
jgi:hypothetical protein